MRLRYCILMRELRQSTQLCEVLLSLNAAPTVQVDSASS